ncbi:hypothetical protein PG999_005637 [Apiospora kogelbergensis]|uniref:3'-5' exonuclease domain-containing protein n=1 Tax=Apiospora kogelbergensis TaxID=1337665 RepID=A0AAW0R2S4_9PEZI
MSSSSANNGAAIVVDAHPPLKNFLDKLAQLTISPPPLEPPSLYIDIEGVRLGRQGSISIITIHVSPISKTYLIDVATLGRTAFTTQGSREYTLRNILESPDVPKVFFDIRNDSDALFSLFDIAVAGVRDLQLLELAVKSQIQSPKPLVSSLQHCIEADLLWTKEAKTDWLKIKEEGKKLFDPKKGGRYEVFAERPLQKAVVRYCAQDVACLPELWSLYMKKLLNKDYGKFWRLLITKATRERIKQSQGQRYDGQAAGKVSGPWDGLMLEPMCDDWVDDSWMFGVVDGCTYTELRFGDFLWVV